MMNTQKLDKHCEKKKIENFISWDFSLENDSIFNDPVVLISDRMTDEEYEERNFAEGAEPSTLVFGWDPDYTTFEPITYDLTTTTTTTSTTTTTTTTTTTITTTSMESSSTFNYSNF